MTDTDHHKLWHPSTTGYTLSSGPAWDSAQWKYQTDVLEQTGMHARQWREERRGQWERVRWRIFLVWSSLALSQMAPSALAILFRVYTLPHGLLGNIWGCIVASNGVLGNLEWQAKHHTREVHVHLKSIRCAILDRAFVWHITAN